MKKCVDNGSIHFGAFDQEIMVRLEKRGKLFNKAVEIAFFAPTAIVVIYYIPALLQVIISDLLSGSIDAQTGSAFAFALGVCAIGIILSLVFAITVNPIFNYIRRSFVKSYEIEEHKAVLRLVGKLHIKELGNACSDLLSKRPGYKIVSGSPYGCVIAAIPERNLLPPCNKRLASC